MRLRKFQSIAVVLGIMACGIGAAQAATISDDDTVALPNDTNSTLNLDQFNTSLGTLTNVWVQVELRLKNAEVEMDNDAVAGQKGTGLVMTTTTSLTPSTAGMLLKSGGGDSINSLDLMIYAEQGFNLAGTTGDTVGEFNATGLGDYADWKAGNLTNGDSGNIDNSVWGGYEGAGQWTVIIKAKYITTATFEGNDGYFQGNTPNGEIYGKVIYTYDPIPEPATIGLLALGSLFGLRRRFA